MQINLLDYVSEVRTLDVHLRDDALDVTLITLRIYKVSWLLGKRGPCYTLPLALEH